MKQRMHWDEVSQTAESVRPIPKWLETIPFVSHVKQPIEYFRLFIDHEVLTLICNQSNLYSCQKDYTQPLFLEIAELDIFIGICFYMSLVKLPRSRYYWHNEVQIPAVSKYMYMRRWEIIKSNLHFSDNSVAPEKGSPNYDRIFKIRPFIELLNDRFNKIPMTEHLVVDEQIVPYDGTRGPRYYTKGKPNPWGFKIWTLADSFGVVYNVDVCVGSTEGQEGHPDVKSTGNIVLKLCKLIPEHLNYKVVMDNYFSGVPLYYELLKMGIHCMGTVKLLRVPAIADIIISDKELKNKGKSSFVEYKGLMKDAEGNLPDDDNESLRLIRWNDNKCFNLMSTFGSAQPEGLVKRWDRTKGQQTKLPVKCLGIVQYYNTHMGVDKMDALMGFYRFFLRSKKWFHRLFFHFLDLCLNNAWLLYMRDFEAARTNENEKASSLYQFKSIISYTLRNQNRPIKKVGRPSTSTDTNFPNIRTRTLKRPLLPTPAVIEDQIGHFPIDVPKRGYCRKEGCKSQIKTMCMKCKVFLCIGAGQGNQCFLDFHGIAYNLEDFPH